jgi:hypothetical protein
MPVLGKMRQEDLEFDTSLGYIARLCFRNRKEKKRRRKRRMKKEKEKKKEEEEKNEFSLKWTSESL